MTFENLWLIRFYVESFKITFVLNSFAYAILISRAKCSLGAIQKPRSQFGGEGVSQKATKGYEGGEGSLPKGHVAKMIENLSKFPFLRDTLDHFKTNL